MSDYYSRDGKSISQDQWLDVYKRDRRVAWDVLPDGKVVSTVYLGLDYRFGEGLPLIFETMVFPSESDFGDIDSDRYTTEAEAIDGHSRMVNKWTNERKGNEQSSKGN